MNLPSGHEQFNPSNYYIKLFSHYKQILSLKHVLHKLIKHLLQV